MDWPDPWPFILLSLAVYRLWRLLAEDTITARLRALVLSDHRYSWWNEVISQARAEGRDAWADPAPGESPPPFSVLRYDAAEWMRCPWCVGWWMSVAAWAGWQAAPTVTLWIAAPFAISAVIGLIVKNLDTQE